MASEYETTAPTQRGDDDDQGIDLRRYVDVLFRRRRLIFTVTALATLVGLIMAIVSPPSYEGVAGIAIVKTRTDLTLDPRFKTLTSEDLAAAGATQALNAEARRQALLGLVQNGDIARAVIEQFKDQLDPRQQNPAFLLRRVKSSIVNKGDLIEIRLSDDDPVLAAALTNAWAQEYERYANALFSGAPTAYSDSVSQEVTRTRQAYQIAQVAYEAFIADNQIDELTRQIAEKQNLVASLQKGREQVVNAAVDTDVRLANESIAAYQAAQSTNKLFPFQKEQEANRVLVASYIDALNTARQSVVNQQVQDKLRMLDGYYDTRARATRMIADATAMRDQVTAGGGYAAATNALALQLLKAQAFASSGGMPAQLQVQLNAAAVPAQLTDINALITSLEQRRVELDAKIAELSAQLLNGEGYIGLPSIVTATTSASNTLALALAQNYPLLFEVGEIGQLGDAAVITTQLAMRLQDRAMEALQSSSSALSLSDANWQNTANQIAVLQKDIRAMQSKLEGQSATKGQLIQARDMTLDAYQALTRKQTEVSIAAAVANSEVRFALPAVVPDTRSRSRWVTAIIAAVLGLLAGVAAAYVAEFFGVEAPPVNRRRPWTLVTGWVLKQSGGMLR